MGFRIFIRKDGELVETTLGDLPTNYIRVRDADGQSLGAVDIDNPTEPEQPEGWEDYYAPLAGDYEARVGFVYSGHLYRGSIHESTNTCGNCDGSNCMDDVPEEELCRKLYRAHLEPSEFDTGKRIPDRSGRPAPFPDYRYPGPDVRQMPLRKARKLERDLRKAIPARGRANRSAVRDDEWNAGYCSVMAVALHRQTGWPIWALLDYAPEQPSARIGDTHHPHGLPFLSHAFVRTPRGTALDAEGETPWAEVQAAAGSYRRGEIRLEPLDVPLLVDIHGPSCDPESPELLAAAEDFLRRTQLLRRWPGGRAAIRDGHSRRTGVSPHTGTLQFDVQVLPASVGLRPCADDPVDSAGRLRPRGVRGSRLGGVAPRQGLRHRGSDPVSRLGAALVQPSLRLPRSRRAGHAADAHATAAARPAHDAAEPVMFRRTRGRRAAHPRACAGGVVTYSRLKSAKLVIQHSPDLDYRMRSLGSFIGKLLGHRSFIDQVNLYWRKYGDSPTKVYTDDLDRPFGVKVFIDGDKTEIWLFAEKNTLEKQEGIELAIQAWLPLHAPGAELL